MSIFKFKYDTNPVEVVEEKVETELSSELIEAFDSKVHCFTAKLNENRPGTVTFANPRAADKAEDAASRGIVPKKTVSVFHKSTNQKLYSAPVKPNGGVDPNHAIKIKALKGEGHAVRLETLQDSGDMVLEDIEQLDDFLNEASKLSPIDAKYQAPNFPKGKVFKGSYGKDAAVATSEPKHFVAPNIWGLTPKEPTAQAKAQARQVTFGDHSKDDTEELASADHGPNINHERFTVVMGDGGFRVVDHNNVVVVGKDGNPLAGYRKKGAAEIALRDHQRMKTEDVVASFTFGELKEAFDNGMNVKVNFKSGSKGTAWVPAPKDGAEFGDEKHLKQIGDYHGGIYTNISKIDHLPDKELPKNDSRGSSHD